MKNIFSKVAITGGSKAKASISLELAKEKPVVLVYKNQHLKQKCIK